MVHVTKGLLRTHQELFEIFSFAQSMKQERRFEIMVDDDFFDSENTGVIDMAIGYCAKFATVRGINRWERIAKVNRYSEIISELLTK